jgi:hypothetical protein
MRTRLKHGRQTLNRLHWSLPVAIAVSSACGGGDGEEEVGALSGSSRPQTPASRPTTGPSSSGSSSSSSGPSSSTTASLAGTWSGSITSLGSRVTRTMAFTADATPLFVCDDGTQTSLTRVGQSFQCTDSWLSGGSERLTLEVLRLVREQTRVEFDLEVLVPGGIRIVNTFDGPMTMSTLSRTILYRYSFVQSGNQLAYTLTDDGGIVIEGGPLSRR